MSLAAFEQGVPVREMRPGDHLCLVSGAADDRERVRAALVASGLDRGDKVLCLADAAEPLAAVDSLRRHGLDPDPAVARGQLVVRVARDTCLPDPRRAVALIRDQAHDAAREGYPALSFAAEMGWAGRDGLGPGPLLEFERGLRPLVEGSGARAVCQYDGRLFSSAALDDLRRQHTGEVSDGCEVSHGVLRLAQLAWPPGLRVSGDVDLTTRAALEAGLARAAAGHGRDVHADLGELGFMDLGGLRVLVETAAGLGPGRSLVLHRVPRHVRHLIELTGWSGAPGLRLSGDPG
ncbi:MEDS domain-containing protein [Bailinhaonella thermotolerans]|uniref:STAS domain-containing protein n=1 Tax=Bailinhaonella thermotolerans TaxID=1070861 RepID=A0A3A4B4W1_9ACTN|nr:MEDS domain-containing protein [Bailinhaonella thermotolerans]RJL32472.1 STAS domain-containing protein [Bailinhaonella thermotolerans]